MDNIIEMKKALINAKTKYENMIKKAVLDCIQDAMDELQDDGEDYEENTYYVKILTVKEATEASDEAFDASELQEERIMGTLKECKCELYRLLEPIDPSCQVEMYLFNDNTVGFEIQVNGMKFEFKYRNRYNNK